MGDMGSAYDVIVIGSGIGGLTAALEAANQGRSVLLLEASGSFGGYLGSFARKGFHFDPGLHYIGLAGEGQPFRVLLDELGLHEVRFRELSPGGFDWYRFPDYEVTLGRGIDAFHQRLRADFPAEKEGLERYFRLLEQVGRAIRGMLSLRGPWDALRALRFVPLVLRNARATYRDILDRFVRDPNLRAALSGPCGDAGLPPGRVSGLQLLAVLDHYKDGAFYPVGGTGAMRDAYLKALRDRGAVLRHSTRVAGITSQGGRADGVVTESGERFRGRAVISNAQGGPTCEMVGWERLPSRLGRRARGMEQSLSSFIVYLGVGEGADVSQVGDRNVWNYETNDIDAMYAEVFKGGLPDGSHGFFLSIPSQKDPGGGMAPAGGHCVEIVAFSTAAPFRPWFDRPVMRRGDEYERLKEGLADQLVARAGKYIPGLAGNVLVRSVSTPATNFSYTGAPDGNIYGPATTPSQLGPNRFGSKGPLRGLFLCGSSTDGPGIVMCAMSGRTAGRLAGKYLGRVS